MQLAEHDEFGIIGDVVDCEDKIVERLLSKNSNRAIGYLTPKARLIFTKSRKAFTKALILWYFDPKCYIRIETVTSGYTISEVLS